VLPYYDTYALPYVQQYSPYIQKANKEYIVPGYRQYGEPYISKGSDFIATEYKRYLEPHVSTAQTTGREYYLNYVAPRMETANRVWIKDVKPTVDVAEQKVEVFYKENVLPNYNKAQPYLVAAYEKGKYLTTAIVAPVVKEGSEKVLGWGRGLWSDVVRPQVGRIGERLGGNNGSG
jgi:hypothetical protein